MKLYEYAAAGLSIAATATVEIRQHSLPTLCLAADDESFADAVRRAFETSAQPSLVNAARESSAAQSWQRKAAELAQLAASACDHKSALAWA
jgi:hypothetical protein